MRAIWPQRCMRAQLVVCHEKCLPEKPCRITFPQSSSLGGGREKYLPAISLESLLSHFKIFSPWALNSLFFWVVFPSLFRQLLDKLQMLHPEAELFQRVRKRWKGTVTMWVQFMRLHYQSCSEDFLPIYVGLSTYISQIYFPLLFQYCFSQAYDQLPQVFLISQELVCYLYL